MLAQGLAWCLRSLLAFGGWSGAGRGGSGALEAVGECPAAFGEFLLVALGACGHAVGERVVVGVALAWVTGVVAQRGFPRFVEDVRAEAWVLAVAQQLVADAPATSLGGFKAWSLLVQPK